MRDVSVHSFRHFFWWCYQETPIIPPDVTALDAIELGKLAITYEVPALLNQLADVLRRKLADRTWKLTPAIAEAGYQATEPSSGLRAVFTMGLCMVERCASKIPVEHRRAWLAIEHTCPGFCRDWKTVDLSPDLPGDFIRAHPCRFHDHDDVDGDRQTIKIHPKTRSGQCPFAEQELFPPAKSTGARDDHVSRQSPSRSTPSTIDPSPTREWPSPPLVTVIEDYDSMVCKVTNGRDLSRVSSETDNEKLVELKDGWILD